MPCDFVEPPEGYKTEGGPILDQAQYLAWDTVKAAIEKLKHPDWEERARQERDQLALYRWLVKESEERSDDERQHAPGRPDEDVRERNAAILAQTHLLADPGGREGLPQPPEGR